MKNKQKISKIIENISFWFISAAFIWWGWNVLAWHFNLPQFNYIEIFAMRMALSAIISIFWKNLSKAIDKS
jgi:hypothetical protein|nr:MAG TPA: hypothetical protein [Caudoviricetes sp.]